MTEKPLLEVKHVEKRSPEVVMRLQRMGSFHQSRLSFMRVLIRRLYKENWTFEFNDWSINDQCVGHAVISAKGPDRTYSLVAFAHDLPDELRSDRVIAEQWDTTFTLFDGVPDKQDIDRLSQNVPLQEAGRISKTELTLSRANRSVRLWTYVSDCLSKGHQPDLSVIADVGYLMRTTAVYGSGKFGAADRENIAHRPEFTGPFQVEMLTVYLIRLFVTRLVEHEARVKGGDKAVTLSPDIRRQIGIGNSTGLGMAPFLVNHPALLSAWINAREEALLRVRLLDHAQESEKNHFTDCFRRAEHDLSHWKSAHPFQIEKCTLLKQDFEAIKQRLSEGVLENSAPWDTFYEWSLTTLSEEGQEYLISLMLEPYGHLIDQLADEMAVDEGSTLRIDGQVSIGALKRIIEERYGWALVIDYQDKANIARFWYVSEAKLEPRLGERFDEEGAELEQPLAIARDVKRLYSELSQTPDNKIVAKFLLENPEYRHIVRRIQLAQGAPYSEIHDNLLSADMMPINMLRCKLSFFGATKFDPRSDRWVRICMFQNAPFPDELDLSRDDWVYPSCDSTDFHE